MSKASEARRARTSAANDVIGQMRDFAHKRGFTLKTFSDSHWRFIGHDHQIDWHTGTGKVILLPDPHRGAYAMTPRAMAEQLIEVSEGRPLKSIEPEVQMTMW